ncbi:hypothetical protein B0H17DRAFT_1139054 [Mycena rosella]|uniref:Uncharacterized protein n=1 Tax=Mycena rosella TaxID=1033263 RepID=A0AAD7G930_MYCRO|nr:hypothetical protein B0H17DRAFT_1139054 [Mycena rosella]
MSENVPCESYFTLDGYEQHRVKLDDVYICPSPADKETHPESNLLKGLCQKAIRIQDASANAFTYGPLGIALLGLNSSVGLPNQIWQAVQTAISSCPSCGHTRTLHAHADHLGGDGSSRGRRIGRASDDEVIVVSDDETNSSLTSAASPPSRATWTTVMKHSPADSPPLGPRRPLRIVAVRRRRCHLPPVVVAVRRASPLVVPHPDPLVVFGRKENMEGHGEGAVLLVKKDEDPQEFPMNQLPDAERMKLLCDVQNKSADAGGDPLADRDHGEKVLPRHIRDVLEELGLEWPCFCTVDCCSLACRIYVVGKQVFAVFPACDFHINLHDIYESTTLVGKFDLSLIPEFHRDPDTVVGRAADYFGEPKTGSDEQYPTEPAALQAAGQFPKSDDLLPAAANACGDTLADWSSRGKDRAQSHPRPAGGATARMAVLLHRRQSQHHRQPHCGDRKAPFTRCCHIPSVCGFHIDLDDVYESTTWAEEFDLSLTLHFHQDSAVVIGRVAHYFGERKAGRSKEM